MGTTLEWKSLHGEPSTFDGSAFLKFLGNNKVVSFIGDSVSRQMFAVLLEAIQVPPQACTSELFLNTLFPVECVLLNDTTNITLRMHNDYYGDNITNNTYFEEADIIVLNFGVWYVERVEDGLRTNHTASNYVSHMIQLLNDIETVRKPHQLIVFRESAEMLNPTTKSLQSMTQELRPILIEHRIPIIAHQSANLKDLFHDRIHWCEPALQLAWLTILLHIAKDWNQSLISETAPEQPSYPAIPLNDRFPAIYTRASYPNEQLDIFNVPSTISFSPQEGTSSIGTPDYGRVLLYITSHMSSQHGKRIV